MKSTLDYNEYWKNRGAKTRGKLMEREDVFLGWINNDSSVLDIACGNSGLLKKLKKDKRCRVEAFDIASIVVEEQKKEGIDARVRNITDKDFALEKTYDYIILSEIVEHLSLPEDLMLKVKDSANFLIITIPNSAFYRFRFKLFFCGRFFKQWAHHPSEHLRFWSHVDFLDWLDGLGFRVVKYEASNGMDIGPIKFYKFWPNLFGHQICYLVSKNEK